MSLLCLECPFFLQVPKQERHLPTPSETVRLRGQKSLDVARINFDVLETYVETEFQTQSSADQTKHSRSFWEKRVSLRYTTTWGEHNIFIHARFDTPKSSVC